VRFYETLYHQTMSVTSERLVLVVDKKEKRLSWHSWNWR